MPITAVQPIGTTTILVTGTTILASALFVPHSPAEEFAEPDYTFHNLMWKTLLILSVLVDDFDHIESSEQDLCPVYFFWVELCNLITNPSASLKHRQLYRETGSRTVLSYKSSSHFIIYLFSILQPSYSNISSFSSIVRRMLFSVPRYLSENRKDDNSLFLFSSVIILAT